MMNKVKEKGKKPEWMGAEQWAAWNQYWQRKDVKLASDQNKENRNKVPSDGSGISIHHRGSRSAATSHIESLLANAPKRLYTEFKETKFKNNRWTCKRSEDIAAEMERRLAGRELPIEEEDQLFLEVNPMDDKGRVYGLGSLGPVVAAPSTSVPHGPHMYTAAQVQELMTQTVAPLHQELAQRDEKIESLEQQQAAMNREMARFAAFMERYQPPPPQ